MASQTATEGGKTELCKFNFKTTWSEFQIASQAVPEQGQAELCIFDFKTTVSSPLQCRSKANVCASTPRMYLLSGYS